VRENRGNGNKKETTIDENKKAVSPNVREESFLIPATSMEFRRTKNKRWVQTSPDTVEVKRLSTVSSKEVESLHSSIGRLQYTDESSQAQVHSADGFRRTVSTGSIISKQGLQRNGRRSEDGPSKNAVFPKLAHNFEPSSHPKGPYSFSSDGVQLRNFMSLPVRKKGNNVTERTYLPVSLQSAAEGKVGQSGKVKDETLHTRNRRTADNPKAEQGEEITNEPNSLGAGQQESIAFCTGFTDMFDFIGELEQDLVKFENQVAFLREQRQRRMDAEGEDQTEDY
jgi:guanyl-specific ribonuclease Sa